MRTFFLASLLLLLASPARASFPSSIYSVPARVDILPDDATGDRVVIEGKFLFLVGDYQYADARCGFLYFRCPAGREALCRMQWQDLRKYIGRPECGGFGMENVVSSAMVRSDRGTLGTPDLWDLGIGIQLGIYLNGKCQPAVQLRCASPAGDAGVPALDLAPPSPDVPALVPDVAPPDAATPAADAPGATATPDAPTPAPDAAIAMPAKVVTSPSGCALAGGHPGSMAVVVLLGLCGLLRARRR